MPKLVGTLTFNGSAVSKAMAQGTVTGDTNPRIQIDAGGRISWGSGSGAADANINRTGAAALTLTGSLTISVNAVVSGNATVTGTLTDGTLTYIRMASGGGNKLWTQSADPGGSASNGDWWAQLP